MGRFAATTEHLRDSACELILREGIRSFSQETLARSAYVSIGSVYERWPSRTEAIADVMATRALPLLREVADHIDFISPAARLSFLLDDTEGRRRLCLASELLLARRDDPTLEESTTAALACLDRIVGPPDSALTWWLTCFAVGWGLLVGGGTPLPQIGTVLAELSPPSKDGWRTESSARVEPTFPPSPNPEPTDDKGRLLKELTRQLLADPRRQGVNTRQITAESGVSTGAMYRRFPSRSDLLRAVLVDEVQSHRYAWSGEMVDALTGSNPLDDCVLVMSNAMWRVYDDTANQNLILELTVAARTDEALRNQLVGQIRAAVDARRDLFGRLQANGVISSHASADSISWLFQAPPIGARLLGSIGRQPAKETVFTGLRAVTAALVAPGD